VIVSEIFPDFSDSLLRYAHLCCCQSALLNYSEYFTTFDGEVKMMKSTKPIYQQWNSGKDQIHYSSH
jgi:hypothetical protein